MIKKALIRGLEDRAIAPEELYNLDDQSLFALMESRNRGGGLFSLAGKVQRGDLFSLAAEFSFDPKKHGGLRELGRRSRYENALALELSSALGISIPGEDLIIDIPEPFSLETGLYVRNEACYFAESSSAFGAETIRAFAKSLYVVRIFTDNARASVVQSYPELESVLHITGKWLQLDI
jgi:hypothetical protein